MDVTLQQYIDRCDDILNYYIGKKKDLKKEHNYEILMMMYILEHSLFKIKNKYKILCNEYDIENNTETIIKYDDRYGQYYCNIDGILLYGNIGNIYNLNDIKKKEEAVSINKADQVLECKYGNLCKGILNERYCKYFHDPKDLYLLYTMNKISYGYFLGAIKLHRNFSNTSWIYTDTINSKSCYMRLFGSKDDLKQRLEFLSMHYPEVLQNNINMFKSQIMHDILILKKISDLGYI